VRPNVGWSTSVRKPFSRQRWLFHREVVDRWGGNLDAGESTARRSRSHSAALVRLKIAASASARAFAMLAPRVSVGEGGSLARLCPTRCRASALGFCYAGEENPAVIRLIER